jgi:hypothetical protein
MDPVDVGASAHGVYDVLTLALNVVQTCFLAWLAVYAKRH